MPREKDMSEEAREIKRDIETGHYFENRERAARKDAQGYAVSYWRSQLDERSKKLVATADEIAAGGRYQKVSVYKAMCDMYDQAIEDGVQQERARAIRELKRKLSPEEKLLVNALGIDKEDFLKQKLGDEYVPPEGEEYEEQSAWNQLNEIEKSLVQGLGISAEDYLAQRDTEIVRSDQKESE
jgi:hypothetical protein